MVGKRHSNTIKERMAARNVSTLKVSMVHTAPSSGPSMGSSCSSQLAELIEKNKKFQNQITLYERGITDKSIHASQNNFGLLNISNESNTECGCSSTSLFGVLEIVGIMIVVLFIIYILYGWIGRYIIYRRRERERQRNKLMVEMENRLGKVATDTAVEISPCQKVHVPEFHKETTFQHLG